jgi:hypothetical protein
MESHYRGLESTVKFSSSHKSLVPAVMALLVLGLYYTYGWVRTEGYVFGLGVPTVLNLGSGECAFMSFYVACAAYLSGLISLFFILRRESAGKVWSVAVRILTHRFFPAAAIILGAVSMVLVRIFLFERFPLTDDENGYVFVAKTLLAGRLKNPAPEFYEFLKFPPMIVDQHLWMGQYTIGHPLLLALGLLTGFEDFVVPAVSAGTLLLIYLIAKDQFGSKTGAIALFLAVLSPQFILTGGTLLGYPAAAFCSALMIFSALRFHSSAKWPWILLFFLASLLLILNRPQSWLCAGVPLGVFFLVVLIQDRESRSWRTFGAGLAVALLSIGAFFLVNYGQTGDPFKTVQAFFLEHWRDGRGMAMGFYVAGFDGIHTPEKAAANLLLNIVRQNIWLFGWPFSFVFMLFIPKGRFVGFLLGWILVHCAFYTLFSAPGINLTGPVYYYELIVPVAILSACGIVRLYELCKEYLLNARGHMCVPAVILSFYIVSFLMFSPVVLTTLRQIALFSSSVYRALDENDVHNAVIFANSIVPDNRYNWVFSPYVSGPNLDREDRIFVLWPKTDEMMEKFLQKYPNRQVWGVRPVEGKMSIWRLK